MTFAQAISEFNPLNDLGQVVLAVKLAGEASFKPGYDNFIGGGFVPPVTDRYLENIHPITGNASDEIARSDEQDIELALDAAHAAKDVWAKSSATELSKLLLKIARPVAGPCLFRRGNLRTVSAVSDRPGFLR